MEHSSGESVVMRRKSAARLIACGVAIAVWFIGFEIQWWLNISEDPMPSIVEAVAAGMALVAAFPALAAGLITLGVLRYRESAQKSN